MEGEGISQWWCGISASVRRRRGRGNERRVTVEWLRRGWCLDEGTSMDEDAHGYAQHGGDGIMQGPERSGGQGGCRGREGVRA